MKRRRLDEWIIRSVLAGPEQESQIRTGRIVMQSRFPMGQPQKTYLVRVFVDVDRDPAEVVTAYRTSNIAKYRKESL